MARTRTAATPLRLLAWPRELVLDPYYGRLNNGLEERGWKVSDFEYLRAAVGSYGLTHLHHPTFPFRNGSKLIALPRMAIAMVLLTWLRLRGSKLVWSLHNLASHEQFHPGLERLFLWWLSKQVSLSIHMSEIGRSAAFKRFPALQERSSALIPLMHFRETYGALPSFSGARGSLGLSEHLDVVLLLGQIRPYKNVPELLRAFSSLAGPDLRLIVVGMPSDRVLEAQIRALAIDDRIGLVLQTASIEAVRTYMAAASLVVAPYSEVLNSGSALLALTHKRPILLPNRGAMAELQTIVGPGWVKVYEPPLAPIKLADALKWAREPRPAAPDLSRFEPARIVLEHHAVFAKLMRRS